MNTVETTATEVWCHAQDHGDRPVIHGAELDYDDVHDGVHYHADLIAAANRRIAVLLEKRSDAAVEVAIHMDVCDSHGYPFRDGALGDLFNERLGKYRALDAELDAARDQRDALEAKRDQDAAFATYEVSA